MLLCIGDGALVGDGDRRRLSPEHSFKTRSEMVALFADLPEATDNTRRDRDALRVPRADAQADIAALHLGRRRAARRGRRVARSGRRRAREAPRRSRLRAGLRRRGLPAAARLRARRHREDGVSRLFPDRRRLHPMGQAAGHTGRAGARLGRRLAGRLRADHHRSRSDPLRPAVRALPQSGTRVDAGLRHRLLPGPPRRGDRLCAPALRRRPRRADHHLRLVPGARGAAQCRPRAGDAARAGRQARQAGAAEPRQAGHPETGGEPTSRAFAKRRRPIRASPNCWPSPSGSKGSIPTPRPTRRGW